MTGTVSNQDIGVTSRNLHVTLATLISGEDQTNNVLVVEQGQYVGVRVEASQTNQALGATGAAGDILHRIIPDATTGTIVIKDNTSVKLTIPAGYEAGKPIEINMISENGAFKITTAASTSCLCIGRFT